MRSEVTGINQISLELQVIVDASCRSWESNYGLLKEHLHSVLLKQMGKEEGFCSGKLGHEEVETDWGKGHLV